MLRGRRDLSALVGMAVVAAVVAGCSAESSGSDAETPMTTTSDGQASSSEHEGHDGETVSTINGEIPPNEPTRVTESKTLIDVVQDGQRHLVFRDVRPPGTRSPIHEHPFGGMTCMESGEMTLYLEGSEPQVAAAGQCYWMPPGKPMTGVNSGDGVAVLFDIFTVPDGEAVWKVVETGQQDLQENFDSANTTGM